MVLQCGFFDSLAIGKAAAPLAAPIVVAVVDCTTAAAVVKGTGVGGLTAPVAVVAGNTCKVGGMAIGGGHNPHSNVSWTPAVPSASQQNLLSTPVSLPSSAAVAANTMLQGGLSMGESLAPLPSKIVLKMLN